MNPEDNAFDWSAVELKLKQEKKIDLIHLIQELAIASWTTQHFLHTRYLFSQDIDRRVQPYQQRINAQFEGDEARPDFAQVAHIIAAYQLASSNDGNGTAELYVFALEVAFGFMRGTSLQDMDYSAELAELAWDMVTHFNRFDDVYPQYKARLQVICADLRQDYDYIDDLTTPFYQLEADMDSSEPFI